MSKKSVNKIISDKRAANLKAFSIGSAFILFAIILVVNILLYLTLDKALSFDTSSNSQNSISQETKDFIDSIPSDKKVRIVGLFEKPTSIKDSNLEYIVPMLDAMEVYSKGKITVEYIDPNTHPNIVNELDPNNVTDIRSDNRLGNFAICCDGKTKFVHPVYDCFSLSYDSSGNPYPTSNKCESAFVNKIFGVTSESTEKAYFLTDIQGTSYDVIQDILMSMNIDCEALSVNSPDFKIPDDCNMLFILNPNVDISEKVQEAIKDYIWNGNHPCNLFVSIGFGKENSNEEYPHLNNVLNEVNLAIDNKYIFELNQDYIVDYEYNISKADLVGSYRDNNSTGLVLSRIPRNIINYGAPVSGIVTEPVVQSSNYVSLYHLNEYDENNEQVYEDAQTSNVAMVAYSDGMDQQINVFVFGTSYFTDDDILSQLGGNSENMQFLTSLLGHVSVSETKYTIPPKDINSFLIDQSKVNQNSVSAISIIFLVAIPMAFVFVAWVVYYRRSHL